MSRGKIKDRQIVALKNHTKLLSLVRNIWEKTTIDIATASGHCRTHRVSERK